MFNHQQYMVVFYLPEVLTEEMIHCIPRQQRTVQRLMEQAKLQSYTLAANKLYLWVVFTCDTESELEQLIKKLPMSKYFEYQYFDVMFSTQANLHPTFSVN
jgi:muconolactone delta-isomerase